MVDRTDEWEAVCPGYHGMVGPFHPISLAGIDTGLLLWAKGYCHSREFSGQNSASIMEIGQETTRCFF